MWKNIFSLLGLHKAQKDDTRFNIILILKYGSKILNGKHNVMTLEMYMLNLRHIIWGKYNGLVDFNKMDLKN